MAWGSCAEEEVTGAKLGKKKGGESGSNDGSGGELRVVEGNWILDDEGTGADGGAVLSEATVAKLSTMALRYSRGTNASKRAARQMVYQFI